MADSQPAHQYQKVSAAVAALGELATGPRGARLAGVLAGDEVVLARMQAAAAVMCTVPVPAELAELADLCELAGLGSRDRVEPDLPGCDLPAAAARWQRYARSSAPSLHRACAADIARGLLRLWDRGRQPSTAGPLARRMRVRQTRLTLLSTVRVRCAALRSELRGDIGELNLGRLQDFPDHVARRLAAVKAELTEAVDWELPGAGAATPAGPDQPPGAADGRLGALLGAAFGLGVALTLGRVLAGLAPEWTGATAAVSAAAGITLAGWVVVIRRLLARRAALDRWVSEAVTGLRAGLDEYIAMRALTAEAIQACTVIEGIGRLADEPSGRLDVPAITDRHRTGASVQVRDGSLSALSGTRSVPGGKTQAGDTE